MKEFILSIILIGAASNSAPFYHNVNDNDISLINNLENAIIQKYATEKTDIQNESITSETQNIREHTIYDAPKNSKFKSYMGYKAITNKNSHQYKLQTKAYTDEHGIRVVDGRLCIAVGSYYSAKIGTHIDLIMENGAVIECILADCKADVHTDSKNQQDINNNSVVEFVVDAALLNVNTKRMGDMSYADDKFKGEIKEIKVYDD